MYLVHYIASNFPVVVCLFNYGPGFSKSTLLAPMVARFQLKRAVIIITRSRVPGDGQMTCIRKEYYLIPRPTLAFQIHGSQDLPWSQ